MTKKKSSWLGALSSIVLRNGITMFGGTMTTISAIAIVVLVVLSVFNVMNTAYIGIITFMVLPGFFVLGLALIPLGVLWQRRRGDVPGETENGAPVLVFDFNKSHTRRAVGLVIFLTFVNIFMISAVSYQGIHYSESVEFCGEICHTVMEPEYTAYLNSPHSKVTCAECHIGPGAPWFVRSKLSGVGQVFAVLFDTYHSPISTPVANLRPAQETCEECHWPKKFTGDLLRVNTKFTEDEANTRMTSVLLMHIGGGEAGGKGIHNWHIDDNKTTMYLPASADHQEISLVRVREKDGTVRNYVPDGFDQDPTAIPDSALEMMDCIDCHNRPTHVFHMPDDAMDDAMTHGRIDPTLPSIKMLGTEALREAVSVEDPEQYIDTHIRSYYEENHTEVLREREGTITRAVDAVQGIFRRNIFPEMEVGWGTYPNNIGHTQFPGCFRCHDDGHVAEDGAVISQDCTACHQVLAWDEENPEILAALGIE